MNSQKKTSSMAYALNLLTSANYRFTSSSVSDKHESDVKKFHFNISRELLLDPKDVETGEMICEGADSIVYKGLFLSQTPVAVKVFHPSVTMSGVTLQQKEKFENEVLFLSKMKHKRIVEFVGACIEPELIIVSELLEGGTLRRLMVNSSPNPLDLKFSPILALDISQAMEHAHSNGIIHRDLNPTNVLLTSDKQHAKLTNFGLATPEITDGLTCEVGSYRWMAPEVSSVETLKIGGKKHYDHKVDIYSFALVFWMLITNKAPFSDIPHQICIPYHANKGKRPSLEGIPDELVSIIESCWAQDSNARPEFKEITVLLKKLLSRCT